MSPKLAPKPTSSFRLCEGFSKSEGNGLAASDRTQFDALDRPERSLWAIRNGYGKILRVNDR
jgi:hypothetical protein